MTSASDPVLPRVETVFRRVLAQPALMLRRDHSDLDINGWDSLSHVQIIVGIEREFGLTLRAGDVIGVRNVGELCDAVRARL